MAKVIVTGATGLVGGAVLARALSHPAVTQVVALGRRPAGIADPRLSDLVVDDFLNLAPVEGALEGAALCCHCLAAYIQRTSRAEYRRITIDYLAQFLSVLERVAPEAAFVTFTTEGTRQDGRSWIHTLNVKGEAERLVLGSRLPRRYVFRPGYIHPSQPRARPVFYDLAMKPVFRLMPAIGIESADLGRAMIETGLNDPRPQAVIENREIRAIAGVS
ncbi:MAG: hypothetical protein OEN23_02940 [Paracoccaceae bacterium]|nr:hypothetical protein [Paracoccaceae bacterium]